MPARQSQSPAKSARHNQPMQDCSKSTWKTHFPGGWLERRYLEQKLETVSGLRDAGQQKSEILHDPPLQLPEPEYLLSSP
jgi:hypothetical protein